MPGPHSLKPPTEELLDNGACHSVIVASSPRLHKYPLFGSGSRQVRIYAPENCNYNRDKELRERIAVTQRVFRSGLNSEKDRPFMCIFVRPR